jgi:hypothetical protein
VSGFVDGALPAAERAEIETHLVSCEDCARQAEAEREIRRRLKALPAVDLPPGLEARVRRHLRRRRFGALRWALPLAASLAVLVLWGRGSPAVVARELAFDHVKCFRKERLPAKVMTSDAQRVRAWFGDQGTRTPVLPDAAGGIEVVGARYCPLPDGSFVPHVYYVGEGKAGERPRRVSVFVLDRRLRLADGYRATFLGETVHLIRAGKLTVGLVGDEPSDLDAFRRRFTTSTALLAALEAPHTH